MMKKVLVLWIAVMLILSLAACDNTASDSKSEGDSSPTAVATQAAEETEAETEEPEPTEPDDSALIEETTAKLIGDWSYTGLEDYLRLTFNDDGTGSYQGLDGTSFTFTYVVTIVHKEYNNGAPYIDKTMVVDYSTGESEEIVIDFLNEELTFHNTDGGGYSGVITDYGAWKRV